MPDHAHPPSASAGTSLEDLAKRGALGTVLAITANLFLLFVARMVLEVPEGFRPFGIGQVAILTATGGVLATIAYRLVEKRAQDPEHVFLWVAGIALAVSWVPDVLLIVGAGQPVPPVLVLMLMHVVAAILIVAALLRGP